MRRGWGLSSSCLVGVDALISHVPLGGEDNSDTVSYEQRATTHLVPQLPK